MVLSCPTFDEDWRHTSENIPSPERLPWTVNQSPAPTCMLILLTSILLARQKVIDEQILV